MCHSQVPAGQEIPNVQTEEVEIPTSDGQTMPTLLCQPTSADAPAVLVICDIFGRSPFYEALAARLADAGYRAIVPDIFFRQGGLDEGTQEEAFGRRAKLNDLQTLRDLHAAIDWLRSRSSDTPTRTGVIGFCMGGTFSLVLTSERTDLATACYYGFPAQKSDTGLPAPLDVVTDMNGPMIAFWGSDDQLVGLDNVARFVEELGTTDIEFEHHIYPGVGHGFLAASRLDPDHQAYEQASDAWSRTISFFERSLN